LINDRLLNFENKINESLKSFFDSKKLPLYDMMSYHFGLHEQNSVTKKRTYAQILKSFCYSVELKNEKILPAALTLEMINAFLEIHDDIESGNPQNGSNDAVWWVWGPAQAINAGDAMHSLARVTLLELSSNNFSNHITSECVSWLDFACLKSLEGRFSDLEMQEGLNSSTDEYISMSKDKSGSIIGLCLAIGACLSEMSTEKQQNLFAAGQSLGIAMNIQSDINQLWSDDESQPIDFLNKKKLFPVLSAIEKGEPKQKRLLGEVYFKRVLEKNDLETVRTIISDLGTKEESENLIKILQKDAYSEIQEITGSDSFNKLLQDCLK